MPRFSLSFLPCTLASATRAAPILAALFMMAGSPVVAQGVGAAPAAATEAAPAVAPPAGAVPYAMPRSEQRLVVSKAGDEYQVMVSWPNGPAPAAGFPVIYLLDGNSAFGTVTESMRRLTRPPGQGRAGLDGAVVVAIGYPTAGDGNDRVRRSYDYTPPQAPAAAAPPAAGRGTPARQGGADVFLDFIEHELKPAIARDYPIDAQRQILMGHSFGGLFALHVLFTRPQAFQSYVAVSPSIWWGDKHLLDEETRFTAKAATQPVQARLVISLGEREQGATVRAPGPAVPGQPGGATGTGQAGDITSDAQLMAGRLAYIPGLDVSFRVHGGETHGSVVPVAYARALPLILTTGQP